MFRGPEPMQKRCESCDNFDIKAKHKRDIIMLIKYFKYKLNKLNEVKQTDISERVNLNGYLSDILKKINMKCQLIIEKDEKTFTSNAIERLINLQSPAQFNVEETRDPIRFREQLLLIFEELEILLN